MCGIAGLLRHPEDTKFDANKLAAELLAGIESRGKDATGAAWFSTAEDKYGPAGTLMVQKAPMPATSFIHNGVLVPKDASNVILHTRLGTLGSEMNNDNNHPVMTGGIVGVHNGMIYNHDELFRKLPTPRIGEVDSEAIFAAIAYGTTTDEDGKHAIGASLVACLEEIDGSAAIAWQRVNGNPSELEVARIYSSPFNYAFTEGGSFIFCSTETDLRAAARRCDIKLKDFKVERLSEGEYMRLVDGEIVDTQEFTPAGMYSYSTRSYGYGSWGSGTTSKVATSTTGSTTIAKKDEPSEPSEPKNDRLDLVSVVVQHISFMDGIERDVDGMDEDEYQKQYEYRELAITRFVDRKVDTDMPEEDVQKLLVELGAYYRPGDVVWTNLPGSNDRGLAQIWLMPQSFPTGAYLLRGLAPNSRYQSGFEPFIVARDLGEFEMVGIASQIDATD